MIRPFRSDCGEKGRGSFQHRIDRFSNAAPIENLEKNRVGKKKPVRMGFSISLVLLGLSLLVVNLGFGMFTPILPQYASTLGIDASVLGFAYSLYNAALVVFLIPAGVMADRFGRVRMIVIGTVMFSLSSLMLAFVKDLVQFAVARMIEGAGTALTTPAVFALTADLAPTERRGRGMGFTGTLETVGSLASPTIGGVVAQAAGLKIPFYVAFVVSLVSAALVAPIRDRKSPVPRLDFRILSSRHVQVLAPKHHGKQKPTGALFQRIHCRYHAGALRARLCAVHVLQTGYGTSRSGICIHSHQWVNTRILIPRRTPLGPVWEKTVRDRRRNHYCLKRHRVLSH